MDDLLVEHLVQTLQVRNLESADGLDGHHERFIGLSALPDGFSPGPQDAQNLGPIEPLTFTMLAEAKRPLPPIGQYDRRPTPVRTGDW